MNVAHVEVRLKQRKMPWTISNSNAKRPAGNLFFLFSVFCVASALVFLIYLGERAIVSQNAMKIDQLKQELQRQEQIYQSLLISTACLKSPERIEKAAIERLSMVAPGHINYIQLPSDYSRTSVQQKDVEVFPVMIAEDFWLARLMKAFDTKVLGKIKPGSTAEARTD